MAAGLIQLSYWNPERPLIDPFCGTGTIPIEAALIGQNIAPGLQRSFASEDWPWFDRKIWKDVRTEARDVKKRSLPAPIMAYDHDPGAIRLSQRGATDAGVGGSIRFGKQEVSDLRSPLDYGCIITNPPYGERLGETEEVEAVYRVMGTTFATMDTWSVYVLTSFRKFEHLFGRRADRRRKLYNGRLECQYYQYQGPRPPRDGMEAAEVPSESVVESAAQPTTEEAPPPSTHSPVVIDVSAIPNASKPEPKLSPNPSAPVANPLETFVAECSEEQQAITVDISHIEKPNHNG